MSHNQPRPEDNDLLAELAEAGWAPDKKLDLAQLSDSDRKVWQNAWPKALSTIEVDLGGKPVNGWNIARTGIGSYGTDYDRRALVAHGGLGANLPEDRSTRTLESTTTARCLTPTETTCCTSALTSSLPYMRSDR